ncbi:MAG: hypothetical protein JSV18_07280 [Candidatus Bathyarchaeota archaeon]|nr:MAG: hypothetical protein JSV18_07280 [Candidatus Bathyarchaeota archaeon]
MREFILEIVGQRGPMWWHWTQQDTNLLIITVTAVVLLAVVLILLLFPRLRGLSSTESIRPMVETQRVEESEETQKKESRTIEVATRILEPDERRVVEALVEAGGTMLQKEISHEVGYSRVKTHRVLVRLIRRGVVTAEKYYNTNRIELADWLKENP